MAFVPLFFPLLLYTLVYAAQNDLIQPVEWVYAFLCMLVGLALAQQVVVRMSGMKYTDFLKSVKGTLFNK